MENTLIPAEIVVLYYNEVLEKWFIHFFQRQILVQSHQEKKFDLMEKKKFVWKAFFDSNKRFIWIK